MVAQPRYPRHDDEPIWDSSGWSPLFAGALKSTERCAHIGEQSHVDAVAAIAEMLDAAAPAPEPVADTTRGRA